MRPVGRLSAIPDGTRYYDENDGAGTGAEEFQAQDGDTKDVTYWKAQARKAFDAREATKAERDAFKARALPDAEFELFQKLKADAEKKEEIRKKTAGDYESLKQQMAEQHQKAIKERDDQIAQFKAERKADRIQAAFSKCGDLFSGSSDSFTILDTEMAIKVLGEYVSLEDDIEGSDGPQVVVRDGKGRIILGDDGNPAPVPEAMKELIQRLPNAHKIIRGGGKSGSGSSGGTNRSAQPDLVELTRLAASGDKKAIEALRTRRAASGGLVMGAAFQR